MDSSLSSWSVFEAEAIDQDDDVASHRSKKQFRPSSDTTDTTASATSFMSIPEHDPFKVTNSNIQSSSSSNDEMSESEETACDNASASTSQTNATFVPPLGLEERFQKLLTLHEQSQVDEQEATQITQKEVDQLLYAKDMYELSMEDREQVLLDIHGVATELVEETPQFVTEKRKELNQALLMSDTAGQAAYSTALRQNAAFVQSQEFQLPFLRCEQWNAEAAAQKILAFFEIKLKLFGAEKLGKPHITISDLSKEDRKTLESGFFQLLPVRDVAGRAIMVPMPMVRYEGAIETLMRAFYYMAMVALQDVETQRKGLIMIGVNVGPNRLIDRKLPWNVHKVRQALPLRTMGIHYCYDDLRMMPMLTIGMLVSNAATRVRFRAHYGSIPEITYKLTTFGIPDQCLPVTDDGEPKIKAFRAWIKSRKKQEDSADDNSKVVVIPGRVDVLLGRGKPIQEHFGNLRYHVLLDHYQQAYEDAKKFEKMQVAQKVVGIVHDYNGRFLKQEGSGWIEVDETVAREKVSHAFRTRRASAPKSNNIKSSSEKRPNPTIDN